MSLRLEVVWAVGQLAEGLPRVLVAAGSDHDSAVPSVSQPADVEGWLRRIAAGRRLESVPVVATHRTIEESLRQVAPGILQLDPASDRYLVVLRCHGRHLDLLLPDGRRRRAPIRRIVSWLREEVVSRHPLPSEWLGPMIGTGRRAERIRSRLLEQRLGDAPVARGWSLQAAPSASLTAQARGARLPGLLVSLLASYGVRMGAVTGSWWFLWKGALSGPTDWGWLLGWAAMVALGHLPFRLLEDWTSGVLSIRSGWLLRRTVLTGAQRLDLEALRREGVGGLLGRSLETSHVERSGVVAVLAAATYGLDLLVYAPALWAGLGGTSHVALLVVWVAVVGAMSARYRRWLELSTIRRQELTGDLVEKMVGHQTRVAQRSPNRWAEGEDEALLAYHRASRRADRWKTMVGSVGAQGWVVASLLLLLPDFLWGETTTGRLALSLGAVLLTRESISFGSLALLASIRAAISARWIAPLVRAALIPVASGVELEESCAPSDLLLEAGDLLYRYPSRSRPVIDHADLSVRRGDRLLVEGPSGGGKSTLGSLLAGLRRPDSGLLLLDGLDFATLGSERWRGRVALAPQFHDNHVFLDSFAFNLLLGRRWPPSRTDLEEAEEVCREIGLGPLLDRMPAGLWEQVGEVGWQLSHGERSRLFLARALLQGADLVILDESLAGLDPEGLRRSLGTVLERAPTLVVIAHP